VVIAAVNGFAIGGGHILHLICDLTIASSTAKFGQAGPRVGSFDAGLGVSYLTRVVGEKRAREIWFLCRQYTAQEAWEMGMVNKVVPPEKLEEEVNKWCQEILSLSPTALKFCKLAFNAETDHMLGFEGWSNATVRMFWATQEAEEAKKAFKEKRKANFSKFR
jgi:naphthoate synthase